MNTSIILYLLIITIFFSYVGFIWMKYGIQKSISASYYALPVKINILFTLFCWGFAFPTIILGSNVLMFLAGSGIVFVGAASRFKESITKPVHMIGAFSAVILSQLSIYLNYELWYLNLVFILLSIIILTYSYLKKKNYFFWWIEIFAFLSVIISFYLIKFN